MQICFSLENINVQFSYFRSLGNVSIRQNLTESFFTISDNTCNDYVNTKRLCPTWGSENIVQVKDSAKRRGTKECGLLEFWVQFWSLKKGINLPIICCIWPHAFHHPPIPSITGRFVVRNTFIQSQIQRFTSWPHLTTYPLAAQTFHTPEDPIDWNWQSTSSTLTNGEYVCGLLFLLKTVDIPCVRRRESAEVHSSMDVNLLNSLHSLKIFESRELNFGRSSDELDQHRCFLNKLGKCNNLSEFRLWHCTSSVSDNGTSC